MASISCNFCFTIPLPLRRFSSLVRLPSLSRLAVGSSALRLMPRPGRRSASDANRSACSRGTPHATATSSIARRSAERAEVKSVQYCCLNLSPSEMSVGRES